jgi:hypothetical protein
MLESVAQLSLDRQVFHEAVVNLWPLMHRNRRPGIDPEKSQLLLVVPWRLKQGLLPFSGMAWFETGAKHIF